ncbi:MAG: PIG-L family deacetylase [Phycisphaerae bacterium]|nr:PIG-L family deacetylase [Phycisphaerae bacterium]
MPEPKTVLAFMAHPDDVEFLCAGTLARLKKEAGCKIAIATATSGDCGSAELRPEQIARIRHKEALAAAKILDADYYCAGCMDLQIFNDRGTFMRFVEVLRKARADVVITAAPVDYMIDHEQTSLIVRAATFAAPIPNVPTEDVDPAEILPGVPHLFYADPLEGKDHFGRQIEPDFVVDITSVIETKERMLACHDSQRAWLRSHHGMDQYIISMKEWSAERGKLIGKPYGEAFRQHRGHAYPSDNVILKLLGEG